MMHGFPRVEGRSLEDEAVLLPSGLEGEVNLLAVAFHRTHQRDVDTWIPLFRSLESEVPGLVGYEIPTISGGWKPVRKFIVFVVRQQMKRQKVRIFLPRP